MSKRGVQKSPVMAFLLLAGLGAAVAVQWPEIQRYLKMTRM